MAIDKTKGLSLVMFLLLLTRCMMEAPLQMNGILEEEALIHGMVFLFACIKRSNAMQRNPSWSPTTSSDFSVLCADQQALERAS